MRSIRMIAAFYAGLFLSVSAYAGTYSGGDGLSEVTAYLISDADDLAELANTPADLSGNYYFRQTANIDLSSLTGTQFQRIGYYGQAFRGVFDGGDYTISNFTYQDSNMDYAGFFGYVLGGNTSIIKNVKMVNVNVTGHNRVGGLIGHGSCIVRNCTIDGGTITGNENIGGLIGYSFNPISNCSVNATVSGSRYVGGIASYFSSSGNSMENCRMRGTISGGNGSMADVGGIVGRLYSGTVTNCSADITITSTGNYTGGIAGSTFTSILIDRCTASGSINSSSSNVGGIVGSLDFANMSSCRADINIQGLDYVGGVAGHISGNSNTVTDCVGQGDVSGRGRVGGFAGRLVVNSGTVTLTRCGADGFDVTTQTPYGGGLIGEVQGNNPGTAIITECFAYPDVSATGSGTNVRNYHAGLIGSALRATISNCSAQGSVITGYQYSGGLVGSMTNCTVTNCYSTGNPSGIADVGGLIGKATTCTVTSSYWDQWTSGKTTSAGGDAKTTSEMQMMATYIGWDFAGDPADGSSDLWRICPEGANYPKLDWELRLHGDYTCPIGTNTEDLAYLAQWWLAQDCPANKKCGGTDLNGSGTTDIADFAIFAQYWLSN